MSPTESRRGALPRGNRVSACAGRMQKQGRTGHLGKDGDHGRVWRARANHNGVGVRLHGIIAKEGNERESMQQQEYQMARPQQERAI